MTSYPRMVGQVADSGSRVNFGQNTIAQMSHLWSLAYHVMLKSPQLSQLYIAQFDKLAALHQWEQQSSISRAYCSKCYTQHIPGMNMSMKTIKEAELPSKQGIKKLKLNTNATTSNSANKSKDNCNTNTLVSVTNSTPSLGPSQDQSGSSLFSKPVVKGANPNVSKMNNTNSTNSNNNANNTLPSFADAGSHLPNATKKSILQGNLSIDKKRELQGCKNKIVYTCLVCHHSTKHATSFTQAESMNLGDPQSLQNMLKKVK